MAATTAAADAAAARARPCRILSNALREAKEDQESAPKKLMLKLYLEGLKTKLKAKGREPVKEGARRDATGTARTSSQFVERVRANQHEPAPTRRHGCACLQTSSLDRAKIGAAACYAKKRSGEHFERRGRARP